MRIPDFSSSPLIWLAASCVALAGAAGCGAGGNDAGGAGGAAGATSAGSGGATGAGGTANGAGGAGNPGSGGALGAGGTGSGGKSGTGGSSTGTGGRTGSGGATGAGGAGGAGGTTSAGSSGLPTPTTSGVPRPAGQPGNLRVLDWAGFKAAISFTFDDAQPSQIAHYAELQAVGVPMTFYICDGNVGLASFDATWTQAAKDGHELGNHTAHHCHADSTGCSFGAWSGSTATEISGNATYITQHYPQSAVWTMASPFGDTGWDTPAQASVFINRGVGGGMIGAGTSDNTDAFNLPIHLAATGETAAQFNTATDAARTAGKWLIFLIHTINPTTANWFNPVDITDVTGSMTHAKGLTDVWTDTVVAIGAYWRGQKLLASTTPTTAGTTQTWTWTLPPHFPSGKFLRVTVGGGTLAQAGRALTWNDHGYYEIALDAGSLTLSP
jgi:peptidoglycan/xylan/chitin deacetylase (PgdA/CDA1 family)